MKAWVRTGVDLVGLWQGLWVINWLMGGTVTTAGFALSVGTYALLQHNKEHNA